MTTSAGAGQTPFIYLLNRMENAAAQLHPADHYYGAKRAAVMDHVQSLELRVQSLEAQVKGLEGLIAEQKLTIGAMLKTTGCDTTTEFIRNGEQWFAKLAAAEAERDKAIKDMQAGWIEATDTAIVQYKERAEKAEADKAAIPAKKELRFDLSDFGRGTIIGWNECVDALDLAQRTAGKEVGNG